MARIEKTARGYRVIAEDGTRTGSQLTLTEANRLMKQWILLEAKRQEGTNAN